VWSATLALLTWDPEIGVQARENMRDVSLVGAGLCDLRIIFGDLPAERGRVLSVRCSQHVVGDVVLVGVSEWCDL